MKLVNKFEIENFWNVPASKDTYSLIRLTYVTEESGGNKNTLTNIHNFYFEFHLSLTLQIKLC